MGEAFIEVQSILSGDMNLIPAFPVTAVSALFHIRISSICIGSYTFAGALSTEYYLMLFCVTTLDNAVWSSHLSGMELGSY